MSGNKDSDGGWRTFLWNSEKGEFLGRTGCSWCKYYFFFPLNVLQVYYGSQTTVRCQTDVTLACLTKGMETASGQWGFFSFFIS